MSATKFLIELTAAHVANPRTLGRDRFQVMACMGRLGAQDIGKRCYLITCADGWSFVQCENEEQLNERLKR